jgi:hypothetical protein
MEDRMNRREFYSEGARVLAAATMIAPFALAQENVAPATGSTRSASRTVIGTYNEAMLADEQVLGEALNVVSELEGHVSWCMWHEGCPLYTVPPGANQLDDQLTNIAALRQCFYDKQAHNQHAVDLIRNANDALLLQVATQTAAAVPSQFQLRDNFWWVAYHEGQMYNWRLQNANHQYSGIRATYHDKQNHNPNARNLLAAVNNAYIKQLIDSM